MFGLRIDPALAIQVLIFAAVFTACQAVYGLLRHGGAKKAVNARLKLAEAGMALGDMVGELRKQRGMGHDGRHKMSWAAWVSDLIIKSGIPYQPRRWALMIAALGGAMAFLAFAVTRNLFCRRRRRAWSPPPFRRSPTSSSWAPGAPRRSACSCPTRSR